MRKSITVGKLICIFLIIITIVTISNLRTENFRRSVINVMSGLGIGETALNEQQQAIKDVAYAYLYRGDSY